MCTTSSSDIHIFILSFFDSYIHSFIFTIHGFIKNRPNDQLPVGLLALLVRALHRYRRGHRFESRTSLIFSGFLFTTAKSCVYNCVFSLPRPVTFGGLSGRKFNVKFETTFLRNGRRIGVKEVKERK